MLKHKKQPKQKLIRGGFGYIKAMKKKYLLKLIILIVIALAIFVLGYYLNKRSSSNLFTVLAILMVLPAAKAVVALVVFFPFQTVSYQRYQKVYEALTEQYNPSVDNYLITPMEETMKSTVVVPDQMMLLTDVVFTSPNKIMNLDFMVITEETITCLLGKTGQKNDYIHKYLSEGLKNQGSKAKLHMYDKEEKFRIAVKTLKVQSGVKEQDAKEKNKSAFELTKDYLLSLIVN